MPNLVTRLFQNREDPGDEVGKRPIFGQPLGICPRFSRMYFSSLKIKILLFRSSKWEEIKPRNNQPLKRRHEAH